MTLTRLDVPIPLHVCAPGERPVARLLPFAWQADQPSEVTIHVPTADGPIGQIVVARWMLDSGRGKYVRPPGGDISVFPDRFDGRFMHIHLRKACGDEVSLRILVLFIDDLLAGTYAIAPAGEEHLFQQVPDDAAYDVWLQSLGGAA